MKKSELFEMTRLRGKKMNIKKMENRMTLLLQRVY